MSKCGKMFQSKEMACAKTQRKEHSAFVELNALFYAWNIEVGWGETREIRKSY